jgi:hypothetical protein
MKAGSRLSLEAVPSDRDSRGRDSSISRTVICRYLPSEASRPSSSSWSTFSMNPSS